MIIFLGVVIAVFIGSIIRLIWLYLPLREVVRNYVAKEKRWEMERKELNDFIKTLVSAREHKIKVQLLDSIYAIHKYDILFDYNITEYMTNNKIDWADISKDIIAAILALESSGGLSSPVIALRRINQGTNGKLEYSFEQLKYNR